MRWALGWGWGGVAGVAWLAWQGVAWRVAAWRGGDGMGRGRLRAVAGRSGAWRGGGRGLLGRGAAQHKVTTRFGPTTRPHPCLGRPAT